MTDSVLADVRTVLVVDWPTRAVPESLARAGFDVVVHGGPGPDDYTAYGLAGVTISTRKVGRPAQADLVYSHRPLGELPEIVEDAKAMGARAVWVQSGRAADGTADPAGCWMPDDDAAAARTVVESAGLAYADRPYIVDALGDLEPRATTS